MNSDDSDPIYDHPEKYNIFFPFYVFILKYTYTSFWATHNALENKLMFNKWITIINLF